MQKWASTSNRIEKCQYQSVVCFTWAHTDRPHLFIKEYDITLNLTTLYMCLYSYITFLSKNEFRKYHSLSDLSSVSLSVTYAKRDLVVTYLLLQFSSNQLHISRVDISG